MSKKRSIEITLPVDGGRGRVVVALGIGGRVSAVSEAECVAELVQEVS